MIERHGKLANRPWFHTSFKTKRLRFMVTLLSFLFFTALVAYVSWVKTRNDDHESSSGYFLAGRSLGWLVIAGSLLLTNLSTEQLVGMNGGGFMHGMQLMAWEVWSAIAIVLMALVFLPRYLKGGVATVSEFLARRYNRSVGTLVSVLLLLSLLTNLLPFVLYSGAVFMQEVFGVDQLFGNDPKLSLWVTVISLGVIGSVYAIFGGLKAVAVSDTLNGVGLLIGGAIIPVCGIIALGDRFGDGGFAEGVEHLMTHRPERLNPVVNDESANVPFSTLFTGMLFITTYYWCTNQAIVQRTFGAKSLADGQKGVLFAAVMKLLAPVYVVLPGIIAFHLFCLHQEGGQEYVIDQLPTQPAVLVSYEDDGATRTSVLEQNDEHLVGGLNEMAFADVESRVGESILVGEGEEAKSYTIKQVVAANTIVSSDEAGSAVLLSQGDVSQQLPMTKADKSYGRLAIKVVPDWMLGFFAAVIFGAILSSFNSGLNSAATLFSVDIYKSLFNTQATEAQMVRTGKIFGTVIAIGAISVAPMIADAQDGLFDLMKKLAAFYNIPLLAVVVVGMFSRRTPSFAAWAAVIVGVVFYGYFGFYMDNTVFGYPLHWLHIAGMNFVLLVVVMLAITKFAPREIAWEQPHSEDVDITPWRFATPVGILILIAIGAMYWGMSTLG